MLTTTTHRTAIKTPTNPGVTTQSYPKLAFCSAITPATPEHYEKLKEAGIDTVSVCLHLSGFTHYKYAMIHTKLAREAEMTTHAYMVTDLYSPIDDVIAFTRRFNQLGYTPTTKITIWINSDQKVSDREEKIRQTIDLLSNYHNRECIDIAFYKRDIDAGFYDCSKLPKMIDLTIINYGAINAGVPVAGTWVYTTDFANIVQTMAYDYYGFYTDNSGYQLSLVDTDYVVQPGDNWYSISRRHGIPMVDLLALNRANPDDDIYEGQIVRIA